MTVIAERLIEVANQTQQNFRDRPLVADFAFVLLVFVLELIDLFGLTANPLLPRDPDLAAVALIALTPMLFAVGRRLQHSMESNASDAAVPQNTSM